MDFYRESSRVGKALIRSAFEQAAMVLALSEQWYAHIIEIAPRSRVAILPNAVEIPSETEILGHDPRMLSILFLGRLGRRKGTNELISAFSRIARDFPNSKLVCAGDGDLQSFEKLACDLGISDRVFFPGWLDKEHLHEQLQIAALFVLPSHAEGLPIALLEAMAWNLAVITCPVGGIPQVIEHGKNGFLVNPGDVDGLELALRTLLSDKGLRDRMGAQARATVEAQYSMDAHLDQLQKLYRSVGGQICS